MKKEIVALLGVGLKSLTTLFVSITINFISKYSVQTDHFLALIIVYMIIVCSIWEYRMIYIDTIRKNGTKKNN